MGIRLKGGNTSEGYILFKPYREVLEQGYRTISCEVDEKGAKQ
jgi:hypothetical protein